MTRYVLRVRRVIASPTLRYLPLALMTALRVEWGLHRREIADLARSLGVPLAITDRAATMRPLMLISAAQLGQHDAVRYRAAHHVMRIWPCGRQAKCLRMALVAGSLLRTRHPTLHLGISSDLGTDRAHAWICIDKQILDPTVAHFAPFVSISSQP